MSTLHRLLIATLTVAMVGSALSFADDRQPNPETFAKITEATRDLIHEIENLQDLVEERSGEKGRALYRQSDAVLAGVELFQSTLKANTSRERLYKTFDEQDDKLDELLKAIQDVESEKRLLMQRAIARIRATDDHLHYLISAGDTSEVRISHVLKRQTRSLFDAARQLEKTGGYSLGTLAGLGVLLGELRKLTSEVEQFQKGMAIGKSRLQLRNDFAVVVRGWEQSILRMRNLKAADHMRLFRAADQFDRIFERIFHLLGIEGERPQLTIRT